MIKAVGKDNVGIDNPLGGYNDIYTDALIATYDYMAKRGVATKEFSDNMTPDLETLFKFLDFESWENLIHTKRQLVLKNREKYEKFVNDTFKEKELDLEIKYDDNSDVNKDGEKFINKTNYWQYVE